MPPRLFKPLKVERVRDFTRPGFRDSQSVRTYGVRATAESRGVRRTFTLIEKEFPESYSGYPKHYFEMSNKLRSLGINVPTVRLIPEKDGGGRRCYISDLSRGGKFKVIEWGKRNLAITEEAKEIANFGEIKRYIEEKTELAAEHNQGIDARAWMVVVDPKTNRGIPYVADFKGVLTIDLSLESR
ncbi:MAG: hypothetical protein NT067_05790 [Candidatus Diapherotrites archaeon]|nr:hypothetical protein [Candidatus Diapherotrites archaeon]